MGSYSAKRSFVELPEVYNILLQRTIISSDSDSRAGYYTHIMSSSTLHFNNEIRRGRNNFLKYFFL